MTETADTVLGEALALPVDECAQVAADLLASLDTELNDIAVASAWAQELERRARRILSDACAGEDWDTARERIGVGSPQGGPRGLAPR